MKTTKKAKKKVGFAALSKAERAKLSSKGGKAAAKARRKTSAK